MNILIFSQEWIGSLGADKQVRVVAHSFRNRNRINNSCRDDYRSSVDGILEDMEAAAAKGDSREVSELVVALPNIDLWLYSVIGRINNHNDRRGKPRSLIVEIRLID